MSAGQRDLYYNNLMFYTNVEIAQFLEKIAVAYEIKNKNRFRIIAYQTAAEYIKSYPKSLEEIWRKNKMDLDNVPGIGEAILKKLDYLFTHHQYPPKVKALFKSIDPAVFVLNEVNTIGPKTAAKLVKEIKFPRDKEKIIEKLIAYAKKNNKPTLLKNAQDFLGIAKRIPLKDAQAISNEIIKYLKNKFPNLLIIPLGSIRRLSETIGDIDLAAQSDQNQEILDYFVNYPKSFGTFDRGPKKASIKLENNLRLDLMIQPQKSWGSLLQHFTGNRQHNILLRRHALKMGLSISEYGIKDLKTGKLHTFTNEPDLYNFLNLNYIKPQDRLGEHEIENALKVL